MKGMVWWWMALGVAGFLGCSQTEQELETAIPLVLSIDFTAQGVDGPLSISGGDFFRAVGDLTALDGVVELRIRDARGWMIFRVTSVAAPGEFGGDWMAIKILGESVAMNDLEMNRQNFSEHLKRYTAAAAMVEALPWITFGAADESRMRDCLKYLRVLHDAGVEWFMT